MQSAAGSQRGPSAVWLYGPVEQMAIAMLDDDGQKLLDSVEAVLNEAERLSAESGYPEAATTPLETEIWSRLNDLRAVYGRDRAAIVSHSQRWHSSGFTETIPIKFDELFTAGQLGRQAQCPACGQTLGIIDFAPGHVRMSCGDVVVK